MPHRDTYIVRAELTISTAITAVQIKAGSTAGFEILDCTVTQKGSTTSAQEKIALVRKTAAATVTAASVGSTGLANGVFMTDPNMSSPALVLSTSGTGFTATSEGTDGDVPLQLGFNVLNGCYEIPVPERRLWVPPSGIIGVKFFSAPSSQIWEFNIGIMEL